MVQLLFLARPVLDYVLPARCPGCGAVVEADHRFCAGCWVKLDFITGIGCRRCAIPLGPLDGLTCARCLADPPPYDAVIAPVAYGEIARKLVLRLKYGRRPGLARTAAALISPRLRPPPDALVVPVPLHRWRLWSRGFNQSLAIGAALARRHSLECRADVLVRTRPTPPLRGLNPSERKRTVRTAFAARAKLDGRPVYLVDDVFTTGATAEACARVLKRAGAGPVTVLCWARVTARD